MTDHGHIDASAVLMIALAALVVIVCLILLGHT